MRIIKTLWVRICLLSFWKSFRTFSPLKYVGLSVCTMFAWQTYWCEFDCYIGSDIFRAYFKYLYCHFFLLYRYLFEAQWFVYEICLWCHLRAGAYPCVVVREARSFVYCRGKGQVNDLLFFYSRFCLSDSVWISNACRVQRCNRAFAVKNCTAAWEPRWPISPPASRLACVRYKRIHSMFYCRINNQIRNTTHI